MAVTPVHLRSTRTCEIALSPIYYKINSPNFLSTKHKAFSPPF
jgi:hypothetical protein